MPAIQPCDKPRCKQDPHFVVMGGESKGKHACADHVDDLRGPSHAVYRYDPIIGSLGEMIRKADNPDIKHPRRSICEEDKVDAI